MTAPTLNKILYVEDDIDIQAVAKMALEVVGGFTLKICSSGQEALDEGEAFAPDLMVLDVMMPGMDGPTTFAQLRKLPSLKSTPAIFMTAKVMPSDVVHYKELGAADVIAKPFDPMDLSVRIQKIWSEWHAD